MTLVPLALAGCIFAFAAICMLHLGKGMKSLAGAGFLLVLALWCAAAIVRLTA